MRREAGSPLGSEPANERHDLLLDLEDGLAREVRRDPEGDVVEARSFEGGELRRDLLRGSREARHADQLVGEDGRLAVEHVREVSAVGLLIEAISRDRET